MQLFAPANLSTYGGGPGPNEGYFFAFDGLLWAVSTPDVTTIGQPSAQGREVWYSGDPAYTATQNNTENTGLFKADAVTGQRYEMGFVEGHKGVLFSAYHLNSQTQTYLTRSMDMVFDDDEWGDGSGYTHLEGYVDATHVENLPITFHTAKIRNRVKTWGLELMGLCRTTQMHSGGYFEFFGGVRYLEFIDRFQVEAFGGEIPSPDDADVTITTGVLADSYWRQEGKNRIVGPQVGARWFKKYGRWTVSTEGRFLAGYNSQSSVQFGQFGSELTTPPGGIGEPLSLGPTSFFNRLNQNEFSPVVEVRAGLDWQLTRSVSIGAGWTGIWMDGIARASNMFNYEFGTNTTMGILGGNNRQDVFMNGANFRIVVNR
ncbi:MAG: BBP7 family outer membrane beta-barrel protein [Planctomycetia bacterium]|nr:BBP7 family outer membrane beta-barrel protein [Planctomycetia bacterium]